MSTYLKNSVVLCALSALTACAGNQSLSGQTTSSIFAGQVENPIYTQATMLQPSEAYVQFPSTHGAALSVDETLYSNGIQQRIVYPAVQGVVGENHIEVNLVSNYDLYDLEKKLAVHSKDSGSLRNKFAREFSGRQLAVSNAPSSNRYGVYGLGFTSMTGGIGCMLGWQTMKSQEVSYRTKNIFNRMRDPKHTKLSYRIRFCKPGLTIAEGHQLMRNVSISASPESLRKRASVLWTAGNANVPAAPAYGVPSNYIPQVIPQPPIVQPVIQQVVEPVVRKPVPKPVRKKKKVVKKKPLVTSSTENTVTLSDNYEAVPLP